MANFIPLAGQKSSKTLIKNVNTFDVWPHPIFAAIWLHEVCHLKIPETVPKLLNGAGTPAALLKVAQGGFKQLETVKKSNLQSIYQLLPFYRSQYIRNF